MKLALHLVLLIVPLGFSASGSEQITVVSGPDLSQTNRFYIGNRSPLLPSQFIGLPVGSVEPRGWVREFLKRQREGLTGHLGEISAWLQKDDNAWLSKNGKGKYGWEELPYWLKGYIELAYIFNDPKMITECKTWIEGTLGSQRADADFGPDQRFEDGSRDYWANMIMLFCLQSYYERSNDPRVLELMTKYFKYQLTVPDKQMLTHYWQRMRGGDNIYSIHWLYNRTGDPELLKVAEKIHRCTANWKMKDDLPNWHNVNIAECFREPAQIFLQTHDKTDLLAAYANHFEIRKRFGQVPGGMFGGDENSRRGYDDPRQAVETCGMVEQMLSDEMMLQISGDPFWADHCEEVAFNTYPAAVMPDFKALRYLTAPNQVVSDSKNHAPGIDNNGPFMMMNPFSSRCCQHNHSHGWPYFNKSLWMATPDNGVLAALYSASEVSVKVDDGATVKFAEETHYPFEDTIRFRFSADRTVAFPLYLRIPAWCNAPKVFVNGSGVSLETVKGKFIRIAREWKSGDEVTLQLPMKVSLQKWTRNHDSVSVNYGPLTFSLKIGERYDLYDSTRTAAGDSHWQKGADTSKWPSFEIQPTTSWNYGLVLDEQSPEKSLIVKQGAWPKDDFPFTTDAAPITIQAKAKQIPEWTLDRHGLCAVLQDSPVFSEQPVETVSLIPMGAARLRIAAFPVIGAGPEAKRWIAPAKPKPAPYKTSASHCNSSDTLDALCDGLEPQNSSDQSIPRMTWWDHRGTTEWVQYDFPNPRTISGTEVYWFDDTGRGQCRVPASWRLLYKSGDTWVPVTTRNDLAVKKDGWNSAQFTAIRTRQLRLEVQLQPHFSGGILEWKLVEGSNAGASAIPHVAPRAIEAAVRMTVEPFDLSDVRLLDSPFKQAMDLNARYLLSLEPDRFLHYFRVNAGLNPKAPAYGGWEAPTTGAGRCLGHYLSALSLQYRATGDSRFKEQADYIVSELAICQQTNGFLSAQTNLAEAFAALAAGRGDALLKSRVPWYIQHKMFAGLRDAYFLTANQQAREILIRLADWAVAVTSNLDRNQFQTMLRQEYGGMLEVLVDVYALTGNRQYLDLARRFQDDETFSPLAAKMDKLAGRHANTMIPKLTGAIRLYESTGEMSERSSAEYFWNQVVEHHTYALGGNSDHEHFGPPDRLPLGTQTAETCNTYNMLKLTRQLFCFNPQVKYADYYEQALCNQILASQEPKESMFTYFVSLKPGHFKTYSTPFDSFWCCVGTGMENHTQYGNGIYYHDTNNLYVVLYIPSQLTWHAKNVTVRQETDYPNSGDMRFTIECAKPTTFGLKFRYPTWAGKDMVIKVNGQVTRHNAQSGEFASVDRDWRNDDQVQVQFPVNLRAKSLPGAPATKAFFFGPLLLGGDLGTTNLPAAIAYARNQCQYCDLPDPKVPTLVMGDEPLESFLKPVAGEPLTFRTANVGHPADVVLRPFYQMHYQRYTVYWDVLSPDEWRKTHR